MQKAEICWGQLLSKLADLGFHSGCLLTTWALPFCHSPPQPCKGPVQLRAGFQASLGAECTCSWSTVYWGKQTRPQMVTTQWGKTEAPGKNNALQRCPGPNPKTRGSDLTGKRPLHMWLSESPWEKIILYYACGPKVIARVLTWGRQEGQSQRERPWQRQWRPEWCRATAKGCSSLQKLEKAKKWILLESLWKECTLTTIVDVWPPEL